MKKLIPLFAFAAIFVTSLNAEDAGFNIKETEPAVVAAKESQRLNLLIEITEKNLNNQKALKKLFMDYQQQQINYLKNPEDKEVTLQMVKSAYQLLEGIKAAHLTQSFDAEFISQLTFFSQFATKRGVR